MIITAITSILQIKPQSTFETRTNVSLGGNKISFTVKKILQSKYLHLYTILLLYKIQNSKSYKVISKHSIVKVDFLQINPLHNIFIVLFFFNKIFDLYTC